MYRCALLAAQRGARSCTWGRQATIQRPHVPLHNLQAVGRQGQQERVPSGVQAERGCGDGGRSAAMHPQPRVSCSMPAAHVPPGRPTAPGRCAAIVPQCAPCPATTRQCALWTLARRGGLSCMPMIIGGNWVSAARDPKMFNPGARWPHRAGPVLLECAHCVAASTLNVAALAAPAAPATCLEDASWPRPGLPASAPSLPHSTTLHAGACRLARQLVRQQLLERLLAGRPESAAPGGCRHAPPAVCFCRITRWVLPPASLSQATPCIVLRSSMGAQHCLPAVACCRPAPMHAH